MKSIIGSSNFRQKMKESPLVQSIHSRVSSTTYNRSSERTSPRPLEPTKTATTTALTPIVIPTVSWDVNEFATEINWWMHRYMSFEAMVLHICSSGLFVVVSENKIIAGESLQNSQVTATTDNHRVPVRIYYEHMQANLHVALKVVVLLIFVAIFSFLISFLFLFTCSRNQGIIFCHISLSLPEPNLKHKREKQERSKSQQ